MLDDTPTAVLLPGQGSQVPGMRDAVAGARPDLLEAVLALVGDDPFERIDESTRFAQPAIFCASLAGWARVAEHVHTPVAFAGHSLGELSALAIAGVLDELDALRLVVLRGALMAESGEASGGTMLALLGAQPAEAATLAQAHDVCVANDNAPGQIVLSGAPENLRAARRRAREQGLRAIPLDVAGAFHSPHMAAAVAPFRTALAEVTLHEPSTVVFSSTTTRPFADPVEELADALVSPVRWRETMAALDTTAGARAYLDPGPGAVLAKLAPRCIPDARVVSLQDVALQPAA